MSFLRIMRNAIGTVVVGKFLAISPLFAADPPLVVRDVNVGFIARGTINDRASYRSTLPAVLLSQRPVPAKPMDNLPQPLGAITFDGSPSDDLDVLLEYDNAAKVFARWPTTDLRSTRALWPKLKLSADQSAPTTAFPSNSWLTPLRNANRLTINTSKRLEKFILYDIAMKSPTTIELESTDQGYKARNIGAATIHDVTIYRPTGKGKYRAAFAREIPGLGKEPAPAPPTAPADQTNTPRQGGAVAQVFQGLATAITGQPAAAAPNGQAADQPAQPKPDAPQHDINWSGQEKSADELLANWKPLLAEQGLGDAEIAHVLSILKERAFDKDSARVVFRVDPATVDKLMPIEVSPQPDKIVRVWLMIYDGADPEIKQRITQLITQLGDSSYDKRMQARDELIKLGPTAVPLLSAEKNNKDAEIAFRIEEILEELQNPSDQKSAPQNAEAILIN